jgi:aspartyl/glutamyl-tRNA(Asn/Gln) amidotransferase C subunit
MALISRDEIIKIAQISNIKLHESEIEPLCKELEAVLAYAQCVTQVEGDVPDNASLAYNVVREDVIISTDPDTLLKQAPDREGSMFVVPLVIEQN